MEWLKSLQGDALSQVSFAVFGCGNRDWALTYQRIPTLCDDTLAARGAKRLTARGEGDAGSSDFFDAFDKWETSLWEALQEVLRTLGSQLFRKLTELFTGVRDKEDRRCP